VLTRYVPQRLLLQQRAVGGRRSAGSRVYAAEAGAGRLGVGDVPARRDVPAIYRAQDCFGQSKVVSVKHRSFRLVSGSRIGRRKAVLGRAATESICTILSLSWQLERTFDSCVSGFCV
jgi:hypothetical protein